MFEKIKRYIHRIKRHRRNRKLSKFANNLFSATLNINYKIVVHPLVYEIINFRHNDIFIFNLIPDFLIPDYYTIIEVKYV